MTIEDYIAKYGEIEGARRFKANERSKQYYQENKEKICSKVKEYRTEHRELILQKKKDYWWSNREKLREKKKEYYKENKEKVLSASKKWRDIHKEQDKSNHKQYYEKNKEKWVTYRKDNQDIINQRQRNLRQTPIGRAKHLVDAYKQKDIKYGRGECTLTARWIVDNIFSRQCLYCGESDWTKLGCDRIDNDKPHTPKNVVCSCFDCNSKRGKKDFLDYAYSIGAKDSDGLDLTNNL